MTVRSFTVPARSVSDLKKSDFLPTTPQKGSLIIPCGNMPKGFEQYQGMSLQVISAIVLSILNQRNPPPPPEETL